MSAKSQFPLYLASSSPRRQQLLTRAGIPFELLLAPVDEDALTADYTSPLDGLGQYLATAKAMEARGVLVREGKWGRILAADTTVLLDGRSLAKPRDLGEAADMLAALRNREHIVATGIALADLNGCVKAATSRTRVRMRNYSDAEIARYVATGDPLDKAGAYSIQHPDFEPVERANGCYLGVMGLPMCLVATMLQRPGVPEAGSCPWSGVCTAPFPTSENPGLASDSLP
jgi:septum formation protein